MIRTLVRDLTRLGALVAVVGAVAGCGVFGGGPTHLSAEFRDAIGLYVGNDVSVLGVRVGQVTAIHPAGTHVTVDMTVDPDIKIPADAGAVTVSPALVANRRVELTPVYRGGPTIRDGAFIPMSRTRTPVEVDEVFAAADNLAGQLGKVEGGRAALTDALDAASTSFQGNGDKLHKAIQGLSAAVGVGADQRNQLIEVIKDVDHLSQQAVDYDGTIRQLVNNLTQASELMDQQGPNLTKTVDNVDDLLDRTTKLIEDNRGVAVDAFHNVQVTAHTMAGHTRELSEAADTLPTAFQNLANVIDPRRQKARAHVNTQDVLLPPGVLQGVCERYHAPLLCAVTSAGDGDAANVRKLALMLLGGSR